MYITASERLSHECENLLRSQKSGTHFILMLSDPYNVLRMAYVLFLEKITQPSPISHWILLVTK